MLTPYQAAILKWAKYYAQMGMIPIPCYGLVPGSDGKLRCTCKYRDRCKDPGKHPCVPGWNKFSSPQQGVAAVTKEMSWQPELNLAIQTGQSGLLVVDLDQKEVKGEYVDGLENFTKLVGDQPFPMGPHQHSGGGGHHFFFQVPIDGKLKTRNLGGGIEFKTDRSLIHVYPSRHYSGGSYRWDPPPSFELMIPPCPEWIIAMSRADGGVSGTKQNQIVTIVREELKKLGKKWGSASGVDKARNGRSLSALAAFDPQKEATLARVREVLPDGSRLTLLQLMSALAEAYPQVKPSCVLEQIKPAIEWRVAQGHSTTYAEIEKMLEDAQQKRAVARGGWRNGLVFGADGVKLLAGLSNVYLFLRHHPLWDDVLGYDERIGAPVFLKQPPFPTTNDTFPREISEDVDLVLICSWFASDQGGRMSVSKNMVGEALVAAARERYSFDAVREYFEKLQWDGVPRLDTWLTEYAGAVDSPYTRRVGATYLISAVARAYQPGCKVDHVLVFEGPQGFKKSTLIKTLAPNPDWVCDTHMEIGNKDAFMQLTGKLFVEFSELSAFRKSTKELIKNHLTSPTDNYRAPYAKRATAVPRRSVFAASTNEEFYLTDETGNRRFWPVRCGETSYDRIMLLREEREQLWAEAVYRYKTPPEDQTHRHDDAPGEIWWLSAEEEALAKEEQDKRRAIHDHPWGDQLDRGLVLHLRETTGDEFEGVDSPERVIRHVNGFVYTADLMSYLKVQSNPNNHSTLCQLLEARGCVRAKDHWGGRGYRLPQHILDRRAQLTVIKGGASDAANTP